MKRDKTSMLALAVAAVILLGVGAKSYHDYVEAKLEKKYAGQSAQPVNPAAPAPPNASTPATDPEGSLDRLPRSVLPPIPPQLLTENDAPQPASPAAGAGTASKDPRMQAELDALRQENALYQQKLDQLRSGKSASDQASTATPAPGIPRSALSAVVNPGSGEKSVPPPMLPGTTPQPDATPAKEGAAPTTGQTEAEIAALNEQIRRQPAIAQVVSYDVEWAVLVINSGAESNIKPQMRLAVRRGTEILGFIKVTEVEANQSVAELMSANKHSPTARKPRPGDDVIAFNLF